ncbi:Glycosyltransferase involved in cell wall biogenesis [Hahella chejuensis KCTC 2396]|uniref:Glycosyltransferase involved in cell wall biogenesis n=1 Tax=Hahella chejuensis (strain KCTC 2396) TaxID=349521 RepID=Q2SD83_HAHCH|nr:glycosyltransferase family 2 protein [Hahella chejuensis]ABC31391.1 Glycosyltransferase involved in cell wall biogenesis [Hahella chejuensis KCTC 2396]
MSKEISAADISVIIPIYNRADKLREALNCIYKQTVLPGEIVVVDDGSKDDPEAVVKEFNDPRIKFKRQENGGPGAARNTAMAMATGRILAFLDSDDDWLPAKLEMQIAKWNELVREGKDCVMLDTFTSSSCNGVVKWHRKIVKDGPSFEGLILENTINGTSSVICEKDPVLQVGGFPETYRFAEDRFVWLTLARAGGCYTVPEILVIKNHEGDNLTDDMEKNLHHKLEFIRHVEREFKLPKKEVAKMKLWMFADFLMAYRRRGNYVKSAEMGGKMWACGDLHLLASHPKALAAMALVMGRQKLLAITGKR